MRSAAAQQLHITRSPNLRHWAIVNMRAKSVGGNLVLCMPLRYRPCNRTIGPYHRIIRDPFLLRSYLIPTSRIRSPAPTSPCTQSCASAAMAFLAEESNVTSLGAFQWTMEMDENGSYHRDNNCGGPPHRARSLLGDRWDRRRLIWIRKGSWCPPVNSGYTWLCL